MLKLEGKILDILNIDLHQEGLEITSCVINKVSIAGCNFIQPVKISNCNINTFIAVGAYFEQGLLVENSIF